MRLVQSELDGDEPKMKAHRAELNNQYDLFTFRYGNLNHPSNKKLILFDAEGFKVLSLERLENDRYVKADIFSKQVNNVQKTFLKPESLKDAVLLSLNAHNGVNVEFISSLMQKSKDDIIREGFDHELLFCNIESRANPYITKDEFLSGNIVQKIEVWEKIKDSERRNALPELTDKDIDTH